MKSPETLQRFVTSSPSMVGWLADMASRSMPRQSLWFQLLQALAMFQTNRVRAKTLPDAARRAGLNPDGLVATVTAHNDAIDQGRAHPRGKPAEFTRRVGDGPYTLLDASVRSSGLTPTPMFTLGGLIVNEETGAAVTADGEPVRGLYAAGRTASGICANSYVSGLSLSDCVFSGRRAGRSVATCPFAGG